MCVNATCLLFSGTIEVAGQANLALSWRDAQRAIAGHSAHATRNVSLRLDVLPLTSLQLNMPGNWTGPEWQILPATVIAVFGGNHSQLRWPSRLDHTPPFNWLYSRTLLPVWRWPQTVKVFS